jgi:TANFOR domain-containing protein
MRWFAIFLVAIAAASFRPADAQDIVEVTTQVLPPYDGSFANFHMKVLVTIRNTTTRVVECRLSGTLASNSVTITLPEDGVPPIILMANQVVQLSAAQLMTYFQEQNVSVAGITKEELYRGNGLPGGNYQLCLRAVNFLNGEFLSLPSPSGCFPFNIQQTAGEDAVNLTTQVIPPYSTYLDDYISQNKLLAVLQNRSGSPQELRLIGSIKGNNGVTITIPASFIPSKPILLAPRQVLQLVGNDLREYFGENVLQYSGISREDVTRGNGLPEGTYQLCLQAIDFDSGDPRSPGSPLGCAMFDLRQYEPPFIIQPACNTTVNATQPQNILFTWSVPAGARPDLVEYILKIVEMYPQNMDPNQALQSANIPPLFEKVVRTNSYVYSLADPKLEPGKIYAFRVTARMNTVSRQARRATPLNFRNNGNSQACTFTYGATSGNQVAVETLDIAHRGFLDTPAPTVNVDPKGVLSIPPAQTNMVPDPEDSQECIADCTVAAPANNSPKTIAPGDEAQIGKFTLKINSGSNASGTGTVEVNFLNTPLNVKFTNLQVNTDNQVFGNSKVTAVMDVASLANHAMVTQATDDPNLTDDQLSAIVQLVQQTDRKVSQFPANNTQGIGLPLSLDYGNFDLILAGVIFTPTQATVSAITSVELPQSTEDDDRLTLSASLCVRPNGFGETGQLTLMDDKTIPFSNKVSLKFNKTTTTASFDCDGIEQISVAGSVVFERNIVLPVDNSGDVVGGNTRVTADFSTTLDDFSDWTVSINQLSHSFTVPQLVGFRMTASQMTFDQSDSSTPQGIGQPASWKGLKIGSLNVVLTGIFKKNNNPLTFSVENFAVGNQGMSGTIDPGETLLLITEGKIGSWPISVTDFSIQLTNSSITGSSIGGKLKLPIAANELDYSVTVMGSQSENETVDFQFNVQQANALDVDMWFAQIDLEETSTIGIQKVGDNYKPTADLTGTIEIGWDENNGPSQNNSVGNFEMPELDFENLTIADNGNSAPDINVGMIEVANADGLDLKLSTFTAHCAPPGFVKNGNTVGLAFDIDLELIKMTNSLNGETAFTIFAEYQNNEFKYKETQLNKIALGGDIGVASMNGEIDIFSNDATFGNGFRGEISVVINALGGAGIDAVLQVGLVNSFNYWYFDVMANLGVAGFNIPGTMASIYGLGGGAYGNMTRSDTPVQTVGELNDDAPYSEVPGANKDGLAFTPQEGTFGFSAAIAFGLTGASAAFNGDLKFSMELESTGAVHHVILEGGCYMMQNITDRDGGLITGTVYAEIEPRIPSATNEENAAQGRPNFRFIAGMHMDIANGVVSGDGTLDLWFSPDEWWIKLGEWENEDEPWEDESRANITVDLKIVEAHFHSYFMMGSNIPGMPKMPLMVREAFEEDSEPLNPAPRIGLLTTNNPEAVPANPGMAFGAGSYFGTDLTFLIFYADIDFVKGFDILLKKYANSSCGPNIGINGWYAQGQAYFYLNFDVGVEIDIWVWEGKASILAATTAATIQAALPNPTWLKGQFLIKGEVLNGLFKFNTGFRFELGEKCEFAEASPFDQMPIISDITPDKNEDDVSVYIVPETAFNFPKEEFSYDEEVDGELVTKTYKYVFQSFTITYKDPQTNANKVIDLKPFMKYRPDGLSSTFYYPDMMLPEHTTVNYTIYVQGWQMAPGSPKKVHDESYTGSFNSGSWPTHIEPEQLVKGNPQFRQNFFLKNEEPTGYLEFKNPHSHFTNSGWWYSEVFKLGTYSGMGSGSFAFKARFKELETNQTYETNYSMQTNKKMVFNIPAGLKNNKIYQLEIVVRFTPPINSFTLGPGGNVNETYENVLINGQQGGGIGALQNLVVQLPGTNPDGNASAMQGSSALAVSAGNQVSNQQMLANNYIALSGVNPSLGPGSFQGSASAPPEPNPTFNASLTMVGMGQGTYIQRKKSQLINKKKGEQGLEWPLFDDLQWYFKTSRFNTLQAKLSSMKNAGVVYHEYTGYYERFNGADAVHEPVFGEGSQIPITTKVPVILLEIEETFEIPYEIGGYTITIAGNQNEQISVPALVSIQHGFDDWMSNEFFYAPTDPYGLPDADDWAQLPFYEDEEGAYLGYYGPLGHQYPAQHWENFIPQPFANEPWNTDRHSGGTNAFPFGNQNFYTPYEVMSGMHKPMQVFYKSSFQHGSIDFGNKGVVWFKTSLLEGDAVLNAINKGKQAGGDDDNGGVPPGGMNFQANVYGQVNTGIQGASQYVANTTQHLAVIDYTEWVAMRDFYLLQKYVYQMNEEEEGTFFTECEGSNYSNDNTTNCFYPGIKSWINNSWHYTPRPSGEYSFRLGNDNTHRDFHYELNTILNPGN